MRRAGDIHRDWRGLPVAGLDAIIGGGTCLILAPHPDDESLGCGGLIAACCAAGRPPLVAVLTDGTGSHPGSRVWPAPALRDLRAREARDAVVGLGLPANRIVFLNQKDSAVPTEGADFDAVSAALAALVEPDCTSILATWRHDPHCDHEAAAKIAAAAAERRGVRLVVYPVWGWTLPKDQTIPDPAGVGWRLNVAPYLAAKRAAIRTHRSQYGGLITDDPSGFQLPPALLSVFETPFETFLIA